LLCVAVSPFSEVHLTSREYCSTHFKKQLLSRNAMLLFTNLQDVSFSDTSWVERH
jgi:hypothetical protein